MDRVPKRIEREDQSPAIRFPRGDVAQAQG
jgi:hypothetical protein